MRNLFSITSFVVLFSFIVFGQPALDRVLATVDIPISASDVTSTIQMAVGLDLTATDCIDPTLGEADLPPLPPSGVFDARFSLQPYCVPDPNTSVLFDYRNAPAFPFTGVIQHTLNIQRSSAGIDVTINYNLPAGAEMTITDAITGTIYTSGPLTGMGAFVINGIGASLTSFWVSMNYVAITPVELSSFTANLVNQEVHLNWTTATEVNNQGFEIERSSVEQSWEKIGYVPGFGTTTETKSYSFIDENVVTGSYTYRLKQIDFDGTFSYSEVVTVEVDLTPGNYELYQNYPNPFNPSTKIEFQVPEVSNVSIAIYDMLGQQIRLLFNDEVVPGRYTLEWNGKNNSGTQMSSGVYIYRITAGDFIQSREMVLMK